MNLLDLITGAGTGGVIGGLLALGNTWLAQKARREDRAHELAILDKTANAAASAAQWDAFRASQLAGASDAAGDSYRWVEAVRKLTRPALTFGLIAAAIWTRTDPLGPDFLLLAGTAVGWWFGSRPLLGSAAKR